MRHARIVLIVVALAAFAATPAAAGGKRPAAAPPPGEETAKAALDASPRHGELIDVPYATTPLRTWIVYPERREKAPVVLLIHEIYGLSDWMRGVADRLAADGYIAVAPDLVSGLGPGGGGTDSFPSRDDVVKAVRSLTPEEARARLDAVRAWATALPAANGRVATMGFCWGGGRSFEYAAVEPAPQAAVVFYGVSPDSATLPRVRAPVLGLYGGDDARVNATIEPAGRTLKSLGRFYESNVYPGAGHGFLRQQSAREGKNLEATRKAWPRVLAFLRKQLGG